MKAFEIQWQASYDIHVVISSFDFWAMSFEWDNNTVNNSGPANKVCHIDTQTHTGHRINIINDNDSTTHQSLHRKFENAHQTE